MDSSTTDSGEKQGSRPLLKPFAALMGLGLIGVLSLIPVIIEQLHRATEFTEAGSFAVSLVAALLNSLLPRQSACAH